MMRDPNNFSVCKNGAVHLNGEPCAKCIADIPFEPHEDITASHHHGNQFSKASNPTRKKKSGDMEKIYQEYIRRGPSGAIREDVYLSLGFSSQTGSARCSDLAKDGRILPVYAANGKRLRGRTLTNSPAGIECADIYAKARPHPVPMPDLEEEQAA
jgi:hypothetical protein